METTNQERIVPAASKPVSRGWWKTELPDLIGHLIFWPILFLGSVLDLWTKRVVFAWLENEPGQSAEVIDAFLTFRLALNDGAAFGIAAGQQVFLVAVSSVALIVILGVFFFGGGRQRAVQVALGLFAAGVSGNLWDRIFNEGLVRDFVDIVYWPGRHWHTFNVADAMLCIAVVLLILVTFFTGSSDQTHDQPQR